MHSTASQLCRGPNCLQCMPIGKLIAVSLDWVCSVALFARTFGVIGLMCSWDVSRMCYKSCLGMNGKMYI